MRVNNICPGLSLTPLMAILQHGESLADTLKAMFENAARELQVGRVAEPREIAEGAIFAMSNGFMTGAILDIDDGRSVT
jgi:NAD(P)-dependent dehydrogenase (short-subunit alcohol dehydrogenase family)